MGSGGIGAFAKGFMDSYSTGLRARKLREATDLENELKVKREKRLSEQFDEQQSFREDQAKALEAYRGKVLSGQDETRKAMETYRAGQADLEQKKYQLQLKSQDLQVWDHLDKAMDPKIPIATRKIILKQMSKKLDIDPKSDEYKQFETLLNDDESMKAISDGLRALAPKAQPGQITALTKSIMTGQILMKDAVAALQSAQDQQGITDIMQGGSGEQASVPTSKVQTSRITDPTPMSQQSAQPGGTLAVPGMESTTGGAAGAESTGPQPIQMTKDEARMKASQLLITGGAKAKEQALALLQYARDTEGKLELKVVVDPKDPNKNKYVTEEVAQGMEAPSARDVLSPAEAGRAEELKKLSEADVERVKQYQKDADEAATMQTSLKAFKSANASGKFETGTAGGFRATVSRLGRFVGLDPKKMDQLDAMGVGDPATADILQSSASQINLSMADKLSRVTNMSLGFVQDAGPGIYRTPEGNAMIVELLDRANQRSLKIADKIEEYRNSGDGSLRPQGKQSFYDWLSKERAKPLVEDDFIEKFKATSKRADKLGSIEDLVKGALTDGSTIKVGDQSYEVTGRTDWTDAKGKAIKTFPIIKMGGGQEFPYLENKDEGKLAPPDSYFLYPDKDGELHLIHRKPKGPAK